jgi:hypothetical protein
MSAMGKSGQGVVHRAQIEYQGRDGMTMRGLIE